METESYNCNSRSSISPCYWSRTNEPAMAWLKRIINILSRISWVKILIWLSPVDQESFTRLSLGISGSYYFKIFAHAYYGICDCWPETGNNLSLAFDSTKSNTCWTAFRPRSFQNICFLNVTSQRVRHKTKRVQLSMDLLWFSLRLQHGTYYTMYYTFIPHET